MKKKLRSFLSMSMGDLFPIWHRTGIIRTPKMPADRVHSGMILSLIAKIIPKFSEPSGAFYDAAEGVVNSVLYESPVVEFYQNEEHVIMEIIASGRNTPFGYLIYIPKNWFRNKDTQKTSKD